MIKVPMFCHTQNTLRRGNFEASIEYLTLF
jgi:hypothetical protein